MKITEETVRHVAALSRLQLSPKEAAVFAGQLDKVLQYFATLNEVDVSGVEPTSYAVPLQCRMRDDVCYPSALREEILQQAPRTEAAHFVVPKVLD